MTRRGSFALVAVFMFSIWFATCLYGIYERAGLDCSALESAAATREGIRVELCYINGSDFKQVRSFIINNGRMDCIRVRDAATGEMLLEQRIYQFHWWRDAPYLRPGELVWGMGAEDSSAPWPPSWWTRYTAKLP